MTDLDNRMDGKKEGRNEQMKEENNLLRNIAF